MTFFDKTSALPRYLASDQLQIDAFLAEQVLHEVALPGVRGGRVLEGEVQAFLLSDGSAHDETSKQEVIARSSAGAAPLEPPWAEATAQPGVSGDRKGSARRGRMNPKDTASLDQEEDPLEDAAFGEIPHVMREDINAGADPETASGYSSR